MSPFEVMHRLTTQIVILFEKYGFFTANHPPSPSFHSQSVRWLGNMREEYCASYCRAADRILSGYQDVFDLSNHYLGHPPQWNKDPLTGKQAPMDFGKTLDYRNEDLVGNIKYLWEPSRHLQLVTLAQAYSQSGSAKYLKGISTQLTSWLDQCTYLFGPHWVSSLELGIRLINWNIVWQLIGGLESALFCGAEGNKLRDRWLQSVYQHVHFIQGHYSKYSSANNHLIGEAAGLFIATSGWPYWKLFEKWQKEAIDILEREVLLQNTSDGVNREQAISYQQFVLDFVLLTELTARSNHIVFSDEYRNRIEKMLEFVASIMDVEGHVPMIGDADDGFVVKLSQEDGWCPYRSLLATGAVLFDRYAFKVKAGCFDSKSKWLLGEEAEMRFNTLTDINEKLPVRTDYTKGGYYILGGNYETRKEVRVVVDAGPTGYKSIAAHGHADALSFTLSVGGKEILVDPGTYAYHTERKWRDYFRGTAAHNTVRVDLQDQSEIGGNFMWMRKANIGELVWSTSDRKDELVASHDGYERLSDAVLHRRRIQYLKHEKVILVEDSLECKAEHYIELFWHCAESCQVEIRSDDVRIINDDVLVTVKLLGLPVRPKIFKGCESRPAGWVSRRFAVKEPTATVVWSAEIVGSTRVSTRLSIEFIGRS